MYFITFLSLGSPRSFKKTSEKSSTPGDPVAQSSRPTSSRSRSSKRSSRNSLPLESDDEHKEEEGGDNKEDKQSSSSSSSLSLSSSNSSDDEQYDDVAEVVTPAASEDEPPAVQIHVSNGNEACLLTKGSHGLLICKLFHCCHQFNYMN